MSVTAAEARVLGEQFRSLCLKIETFRFSHFEKLTAAERKKLEEHEWDLLNASSEMVTTACGQTMSEAETSLEELTGAAKEAGKAVERLEDVKKVITMAAAAAGLAAAICAKDLSAVKTSCKSLLKAVKA